MYSHSDHDVLVRGGEQECDEECGGDDGKGWGDGLVWGGGSGLGGGSGQGGGARRACVSPGVISQDGDDGGDDGTGKSLERRI